MLRLNQITSPSDRKDRVNPEVKRFKEWRWFCKSCGVAKTSADREAGHCTNCGK